MAGDYPENYGRGDYRPYDRDRSQHDERGLFDRIGNKLHQTWDRMTGDEDDHRRQQRTHVPRERESGYRSSPYGAGASGDYSGGTRYGEGGSQSGGGSGYGQSQLGRYSPQRAQGSSYGGGGSYRSESSNTGYSGRMSEYGGAPQRGTSGSGQGYSSPGESNYRGGSSPYGASGSYYGSAQGDPYGSGVPRSYGDSSNYGAPSGAYGRSSMGFPRGSDYGSSGSGSMGGGYFGSGAGPWSGGPFGETGSGGYTPKRNQDSSSNSDYQYSRREQRRRGESDEGYGNHYSS